MDMEVDEAAPKPTIRSAVTVPRARATPTAAPRNTASRATGPPDQSPRPASQRPNIAATPQTPQRDPVVAHGVRCPLCRRQHALRLCAIFRGMQPLQRQQVAQAHGHCLNCLALWHATTECTSSTLCQLCDRPHHTLPHRTSRRNVAVVPSPRNNVRQRPRTHHQPQAPLPYWQQNQHPRQWTHPGARYRPQASHRRPSTTQRSRRPSGLSNVVATLQQLQRLLG
ncbi:uncharacterized protein [Eurosta solidaginis]|uniref:uncharacterized protein n=1 Tax=Eurosta solidaginis TaxID=178769 RepID=UPI003530EDA5